MMTEPNISSHTTPYGSNPEDGVEFNAPDPELRQKRCDTFGVQCFRDAHPESQSGQCAIHTLMGWAAELKRSPWDQEIQAEFAAWTVRAAKEMG